MAVTGTDPPVGHTFIVALEYQGGNVASDAAQPGRRAVREHAYDLATAALADHLPPDAPAPRVAFPNPTRGWNTSPHSPRCTPCDAAVLAIVRDVIAQAIADAADPTT
jgi:hypothetical protein